MILLPFIFQFSSGTYDLRFSAISYGLQSIWLHLFEIIEIILAYSFSYSMYSYKRVSAISL